MSRSCERPLPLDELLAYRRGELEPAAEQALEEHYFGCATCAERLAWLEGLQTAVTDGLRQGLFSVAVTAGSLDRLRRAGVRMRHYAVDVGETVHCTIAPGEDMTVVTLKPPLRAAAPLTIVAELLDRDSGERVHQEWPAFQDQVTGEITMALAGSAQRAIGRVLYSLSVRYGDAPDAETAGPFLMDHCPWERREHSQ